MSHEGFIHYRYLASLKHEGLQYGFTVFREFEAGNLGWVDLLMIQNNHRIAVEVEMRARRNRIALDIEKAIAVEATELMIVCPHQDVIQAIKRTIESLEKQAEGLPIYLLLKHQAAKRLRKLSTAP